MWRDESRLGLVSNTWLLLVSVSSRDGGPTGPRGQYGSHFAFPVWWQENIYPIC